MSTIACQISDAIEELELQLDELDAFQLLPSEEFRGDDGAPCRHTCSGGTECGHTG